MKKLSLIYRFFAAITALMVFISISMPAGLYAQVKMADFCPTQMEHHHGKTPMPAGHCDMAMATQHQMPSQAQKADMDNVADCYFSLDCTFNVASAKSISITSPTVQAKVILPATVLDFTAESQSVDRLYEIPVPNQDSSPPPVFLVNSSFLN